MFRLFQISVLAAMLVTTLAPQIACFMPDQPLTPHEMDCCAKLTKDCGQTNMSCCPTPVRNDAGVITKPVQDLLPHVHAALVPVGITSAMMATNAANTPVPSDHAPPPDIGVSSPVLRI
jgi:hypothetical protein